METSDEVKKYLSTIGRIGGKKSRRTLTREQAQEMVRARTKKQSIEKQP